MVSDWRVRVFLNVYRQLLKGKFANSHLNFLHTPAPIVLNGWFDVEHGFVNGFAISDNTYMVLPWNLTKYVVFFN